MAKSAGKVEQNRQHRMRRFADASLHIVATEGLAALTMARLAEELDTVLSSVQTASEKHQVLVTLNHALADRKILG